MMKAGDVFDLLKKAYEMEVRNRNRETEFNKEMTMYLRLVARWLTDSSMKPGLLLFGGVGNGKTTTATAIYEAISSLKDAGKEAREKLIREAYTNRLPKTEFDWIINFPSPKKRTAKQLADIASREDKEEFESYRDSRFLIIDDLGCEPSALKVWGTEITPITDIICHRYDMLLPTVITTNLDMSGLKEMYGERVTDRLKEFCDMIAYHNSTYRK